MFSSLSLVKIFWLLLLLLAGVACWIPGFSTFWVQLLVFAYTLLLISVTWMLQREIQSATQSKALLNIVNDRFKARLSAEMHWSWEADKQMRIIWLSPAYQNRVLFADKALLKQELTTLLPANISPILSAHRPFRNVVFDVEYQQKTRTFQLSGEPLFDEQDIFSGYIGVGADITEQLEESAELRHNRRTLEELLANMPGVAYRVTPDEQRLFVFASAGAMSLLGVPPASLTHSEKPHTLNEFIHSDDLSRVWDEISQAMSKSKPYRLIYRLQLKEQEIKWVWEQGKVILDDAGAPQHLEGLISDITTQRLQQEELKQMRRYLRSILDAMPSVLLGVNPEGMLCDWNLSAKTNAGISWAEVRGLPFYQVFPQLLPAKDRILRALAEELSLSAFRLRSDFDGKPLYFEVNVFPIPSDSSARAIIKFEDITTRVHAEEMLTQTEKMLSLGGLSVGVAHEINNPLGTIIQGVQNIQRRLDPARPHNLDAAKGLDVDMEQVSRYLTKREIYRFLDSILQAGGRASRLVRDMLSFARRNPLVMQHVNTQELLETSLNLALNDYNLTQQHNIDRLQITIEDCRDCPTLYCEPNAMEQVLINLIKNAAQATLSRADHTPQIWLRAYTRGAFSVVEVEDNGTGMTAETARRVFEPFFSTKTVGQGTGLGLSVSYFIVTSQHNGELDVISELNHGSRFLIRLPQEKIFC